MKRGTRIGWLLIALSVVMSLWVIIGQSRSQAEEVSIDDVTYDLSNDGTEVSGFKAGTHSTRVNLSGSNLKDATRIASSAFSGNSSITSVTIGSPITTVGASAFAGDSGITSLVLSNISTIESSAFQGTSSLSSVNLPNSLKTIGSNAFEGSGLTSVSIPASVTSMPSSAFSGCMALQTMTVAGGNQDFSSHDGALYNKAGTELILIPADYNGASQTFQVREGTTSIAAGAFNDTHFDTVIIPESVVQIGNQADPTGSIGLISGYAGSYAERYAKENGIPFEVAGQTSALRTVTFDLNGGTLNGQTQIAPVEVRSGSTVADPGNGVLPVKDGVSGQWTQEGSGRAWDFANDPVTRNMTLVAIYDDQPLPTGNYEVTFDLNGGTVPAGTKTNITVKAGQTIPLLNPAPTRTGYTFSGWYTAKDTNDASIYNGQAVTRDMTLYAGWSKNPDQGGDPNKGSKPGPGGSTTNPNGSNTNPNTGRTTHTNGSVTDSRGTTIVGPGGSSHTKDATPKTAGPIDARYFLCLAILLCGIGVLLYSRSKRMAYVSKNSRRLNR